MTDVVLPSSSESKLTPLLILHELGAWRERSLAGYVDTLTQASSGLYSLRGEDHRDRQDNLYNAFTDRLGSRGRGSPQTNTVTINSREASNSKHLLYYVVIVELAS